MKRTLLALSLALAACAGSPTYESTAITPPALASDAAAADVYEAWRSHAARTDRRLFVHLGAPW